MSKGHPQSTDVVNRLSRIEGHVRGIKKMAENSKPCSEILLQINAVQAALRKVGEIVLNDHLEHCILEADPGEIRDLVAELQEAISLFGH